MSPSSNHALLRVLIATGALVLPAVAIVPQANAATIYACVKKGTGSARFTSKRAKCRKGETRLSWNSLGPAGPAGSRGAPGAQGAPGSLGAAGPQGVPGPGARVATLTTASSNPATQTLFSYGGDSIGATCGTSGDPSFGSFELKGDNAEAFGDASLAYYDEGTGTPNLLSLPVFAFFAPGSSYSAFASVSFTTKAGYSAVSSTQLTFLESGPAALDFHVALSDEIRDVSSSLSDCKFAAVYYPVAAG
jgi:hypothetical protein